MENKRLKPLNVAFDKITVLGDLKQDTHLERFKEYLEEKGFKKQEYDSANYGYKEIYKSEIFGYIEIAEALNKSETDHNRLNRNLSLIKRNKQHIRDHGASEHIPSLAELNSAQEETLELLKKCDERGFLKRMKDIRFEYNPKYAKYGADKENVAEIQKEILSMLTNKHCTQVHIAMDYHKAIQKLLFMDKKARTECIFRDRSKRNETLYLGDRSSREYLCFYDKKGEVKAEGTLDQYPDLDKVARFEARLKGTKIDEFTENGLNPFKDIKVYNYSGHDLQELDPEQEALAIGFIFKLRKGVDPLAGMTRRKKEKYKELLDTIIKTSLTLEKDYEKEKSRLAGELIELLK